MALKRELSSSLANLQHSVKRLHIEEDLASQGDIVSERSGSSNTSRKSFEINTGNKSTMNSPNRAPTIDVQHHPITTVLSTAGVDFSSKYDIINEIGRGGFSVVYHCREIKSGKSYAVKIIDLRPLRLRDSFDAMRLRREVDIMRKLRHPNIVQFEEVFESPDQLFVVMEYAPGYELFDAILGRGHYSEADAMPIFAQIARALLYLHCMNIIHRDIKPENILVLRDPDPVTGRPIAKLLDFGLSKHTGLGSEAKTFVGTPCYLAPEVEFASKGTGATYGAPADCWSLGAVLYVMLVARFPVFEVDNTSRPPTTRLSLPSELFRNTTADAKNLLLNLMCFNVSKRLTARQALNHPWLAPQYALSPAEAAEYEAIAARAAVDTIPPLPPHFIPSSLNDISANIVTTMEIVRRVEPSKSPKISNGRTQLNISKNSDKLGLTPLIIFQSNIATCFDEALAAYQYMPEVATEIRRGADLCRRQLQESTKMLRKIEQTACSVLEMFPDLELAISEGEPALATKFFGMMKGWVTELMVLVETTQTANRASMQQIQRIVEKSTQQLHTEMLQREVAASLSNNLSGKGSPGGDLLAGAAINAEFLIKMKKLLASVLKKNEATNVIDELDHNEVPIAEELEVEYEGMDVDGGGGSQPSKKDSMEHQLLQLFDIMLGRVLDSGLNNSSNPLAIEYSPAKDEKEKIEPVAEKTTGKFTSPTPMSGAFIDESFEEDSPAVEKVGDDETRSASVYSSETDNSVFSEARKELQHALGMLRQVDVILEQLSVFWANTEIVLDMLTKKGLHAEQFIQFAHKPKLYARFMERVVDYRNFWEGIKAMCQNYLVGAGTSAPQDPDIRLLDRFSTPPSDDMFYNQGSSHSLHQKIIESPF